LGGNSLSLSSYVCVSLCVCVWYMNIKLYFYLFPFLLLLNRLLLPSSSPRRAHKAKFIRKHFILIRMLSLALPFAKVLRPVPLSLCTTTPHHPPPTSSSLATSSSTLLFACLFAIVVVIVFIVTMPAPLAPMSRKKRTRCLVGLGVEWGEKAKTKQRNGERRKENRERTLQKCVATSLTWLQWRRHRIIALTAAPVPPELLLPLLGSLVSMLHAPRSTPHSPLSRFSIRFSCCSALGEFLHSHVRRKCS